ncbi:MAG: copper amine oxidase N-terminal domain-containing protein, partial [Clostridiales bacterium]|nr:copper amine oxidase N-terminal domain-containing protein [Clostridiales bacterium]
TILNSRTDVTLTHILNHYNRTDRGLGLGLDESGFANIRWTINESHGFFDIAGAQIRADLFDRGNLSAYSFGVGDFNADYIRGLPIEFTAHGYQGYVFSHFEISGGINETVHANPAVITPTANDEQITVNAVFERTTPQVTLILQIGNPAIVNHNGNATMDVPPIIINGRTLVPLRAIANILDAEISWNEETREATLVSDDRTLLIPIGTTIPEIEPEISAQIIDGRIMVPLRFIAEFFGADVTWDAAERIIEIIR